MIVCVKFLWQFYLIDTWRAATFLFLPSNRHLNIRALVCLIDSCHSNSPGCRHFVSCFFNLSNVFASRRNYEFMQSRARNSDSFGKASQPRWTENDTGTKYRNVRNIFVGLVTLVRVSGPPGRSAAQVWNARHFVKTDRKAYRFLFTFSRCAFYNICMSLFFVTNFAFENN